MFKGTCTGKAFIYFYFSFLLIDTGIEMNHKICGKGNSELQDNQPECSPQESRGLNPPGSRIMGKDKKTAGNSHHRFTKGDLQNHT